MTEKDVRFGRTIRRSFARCEEILEMPNLLDIQKKSYQWLLDTGLPDVLHDAGTVTDDRGALELTFSSLSVEEPPEYDIEECRARKETCSCPIKANVSLRRISDGQVTEQEICLGDLPVMTPSGTFIINGTERVIVSQLVRFPGMYYSRTEDRTGGMTFSARIIPCRGAWLEYEADSSGIFFVRINKGKKLPVTCLIRALGPRTDAGIIDMFGEDPRIIATLGRDACRTCEDAMLEICSRMRPDRSPSLDEAEKLLNETFFDARRCDISNAGRCKFNRKLALWRRIEGHSLAEPAVSPRTGEVIAESGEVLTRARAQEIDWAGVNEVVLSLENGPVKVFSNNVVPLENFVPFSPEELGIDQLVRFNVLEQLLDDCGDDREALKAAIIENRQELIPRHITVEDIMASINYLNCLVSGIGSLDDMDHLGSRRLRCVGELIQEKFRSGFDSMEQRIRQKMNSRDPAEFTLHDLNGILPVTRDIRELFTSSPLSQPVDQTNPLAELTHMRRISATGPGGLSRDRASFDVRDVHYSHYGRLCPIETPEGSSIGLISSLASCARVDKYGFIEAPYRRVDKETGTVTDEIIYMTADEEDEYTIAQATEPLDEQGRFIHDRITCRHRSETVTVDRRMVDCVDVSPKMMVSVASAMIPFLQNDDASRAMMGANMQRQAVPLLRPEAPIVATGQEYRNCIDSGTAVLAEGNGTVVQVSASRITVQYDDPDLGRRNYQLDRFLRSSSKTCISQRPAVDAGQRVAFRDVLADGPATDQGEIALGKNVLMGFMTWEGYNYEDAVLISERMVRDDVFTSIHIEEYERKVRDTRTEAEIITRDIPGASAADLCSLDERGIVRVGTEVRTGDYLVGIVKKDSKAAAEEEMWQHILGKKKQDVSLKVPPGEYGTVTDVKVLSREDGDKLDEGVRQVVRVCVAQKRKISVGDKMAGRHGNKGVVSRILPQEDMPFLPDGTPLDIVLNPLGVPSRMNIGQVLEVHLGYAAHELGWKVATPVFDGASEQDILELLKQAGLAREAGRDESLIGKQLYLYTGDPADENMMVPLTPEQMSDRAQVREWQKAGLLRLIDGKSWLYDGRTGDRFDSPVTAGYVYFLKLHHLVDDKIHARATGPYSLVTQQPLGGKAQFGGQRFGEMEVWALEAYGAAYTLQELLTVKSDDVTGREKTYEAIVKGLNVPKPGVPESFKVLLKELQSLCLDIRVLDEAGREISLSCSDDSTCAPASAETIDAVRIGMASPEQIRSWSCGEVKSKNTFSTRTGKPEKDGLFCERIFGPTRDWECSCGKYRGFRYKGRICEKCGVEITRAKVRRERMGHIELAAPVSHIWYSSGNPSPMSLLLDIGQKKLESVLCFSRYIVTDPGDTPLSRCQDLSDREYQDMKEKYEDGFDAGTGAEAIQKLLSQIDLEELSRKLRMDLKSTSGQKKARIVRRLELVDAFRRSGSRPEWMVLNVLPVLPPDLRPSDLRNGKYNYSDVTELYRRVIECSNELRNMKEFLRGDPSHPIIIIWKRKLQEAVDSLLDNGRRGRAATDDRNSKRKLKSLSDRLKGKKGRFRQNLLGKRVDYSGRSVIMVEPSLKICQCGLPREMAIELFRPFVMKDLVDRGAASSSKAAKKMVEKGDPAVWDSLDFVIRDHPVMLNRAPTLHRLGIQAFEPVLVEDRAIRLHPLVCAAFNADFDGDQMAVHVPLSAEAQAEARILMFSASSLLRPQDGSPVTIPSQDMVLGVYYLTCAMDEAEPGHAFCCREEAMLACDAGVVTLHTPIRVLMEGEISGVMERRLVETTAGRLIFNEIIPQDLGFVDRLDPEHALDPEINFTAGRKHLGQIIARCIDRHGFTRTAVMLDAIKDLGFHYSTVGSLSVAAADMTVPARKHEIIAATEQETARIDRQYRRGLITNDERCRLTIAAWERTTRDVTDALTESMDPCNPIFMMADSGARGSMAQIRQLAGMRGLMADAAGRTIEIPIKSNFREGLSVLEYFISSRGARKGMTDKALRTPSSGYLTRRLVDVSQNVVIREEDCGTRDSIEVRAFEDRGKEIESFAERIDGRFTAGDIVDPSTGEVLFTRNTMLRKKDAANLEKRGIKSARVRSVLTCRSRSGVCAKCYGISLAAGEPAEIGEAVGIIAAQSIGEPGTQLTMRTFHTGGVAGGDITQGLPRVEELFEARKPQKTAQLAETGGRVSLKETRKNSLTTVAVVGEDGSAVQYELPVSSGIRVHDGDEVESGFQLNDGALSPHDVLRIRGLSACQDYLISEVQKVYRQQGVDVSDRHIEVIVRQMMRRVRVEDAGDTGLLSGSTIDLSEFTDAEEDIRKRREEGELNEDGEELRFPTCTRILLGITKASLTTESFLSAASFQETTKVLTEAAIKGKVDRLQGLKESVIVGKLIPAGSGLLQYRRTDAIDDEGNPITGLDGTSRHSSESEPE